MRTGEVVDRVKTQVREGNHLGKDSNRYGAENYPMAMSVGCLALGVLVGLMLPRTQREDELMGEASARVVDKTKQVGNQILDKTKEVANEVVNTVTQEAKAQGLTPSNLVDKVGQVASTAGQTIKEKTRQEGTKVAEQVTRKASAGTQTGTPQLVPASEPREPATIGPAPGCGCGPV